MTVTEMLETPGLMRAVRVAAQIIRERNQLEEARMKARRR